MTDESVLSARRAARVLLVDDAGRVFLLRGSDPARPDHKYWFTVGGGIDDGETALEAAVREVAEETGLRLAPEDLRGPVHSDVTRFSFDGRWYDQQQEFFIADVPAWDVDISGLDEIEQRSVDAWRWWSIEELARTDDLVYPADLVTLLRREVG